MSDDKRSSGYIILFVGVIGMGIVLLLMLQGLGFVTEETVGATRAKLATAAMEKFGAVEATVEFRDSLPSEGRSSEAEEGETIKLFKVLVLRYVTKKAAANLDAQQEELGNVARFVYRETLKYEDAEIYQTELIDVQRVELHESGCSRTTYDAYYKLPIPRRKKEAPPPEEESDGKPGEKKEPVEEGK